MRSSTVHDFLNVRSRLFILLMCFAVYHGTLIAQTSSPTTDTFKVYGNCDMCKETMEGALKKKDGVLKKDWNTETKMLTVTYDSTKISLAQIKQKLADAGYDTDDVRATNETYHKLHKCCQYERPKTLQH